MRTITFNCDGCGKSADFSGLRNKAHFTVFPLGNDEELELFVANELCDDCAQNLQERFSEWIEAWTGDRHDQVKRQAEVAV